MLKVLLAASWLQECNPTDYEINIQTKDTRY